MKTFMLKSIKDSKVSNLQHFRSSLVSSSLSDSKEPDTASCIMELYFSSGASRPSQLQQWVLDRGSGFVELCCLATDTDTNLLVMDQRSSQLCGEYLAGRKEAVLHLQQ